jgi:hypothetical protein
MKNGRDYFVIGAALILGVGYLLLPWVTIGNTTGITMWGVALALVGLYMVYRDRWFWWLSLLAVPALIWFFTWLNSNPFGRQVIGIGYYVTIVGVVAALIGGLLPMPEPDEDEE